jgi:N-acetylneuraminic acid mutarotase
LLPSGKVLVVGGFNTAASASSLAVAELFDPATNTWSSAGSLSNARYAHTGTLLFNGKVLIAGGVAGIGTLAASELYDPASNAWSAASPMGISRSSHTASTMPNGKVLVTGGSGIDSARFNTRRTAELYDPLAGTWTATAQMAVARSSHTETVLPEC